MMFAGESFHGVGKEKDTYLQFSGTLGNGEESLAVWGESNLQRRQDYLQCIWGDSCHLGCVYFLPGKK